MKATFDFTGAKVFVFGGTSGINLGIAHRFAECGATVAVASRKPDKVDAACAALREHGGVVAGYALDVRDAAAVEEAVADFHRTHGEIDVLISGAAGNFPAPAVGMSPNAFKSVVDIDLLGTYHVMRAGFSRMRQPGGCMINISAPQAQVPMVMQAHVCAAKAGVDLLTQTCALEWGPVGIRVNAVVPGPIAGTEGMARLAPTPEMQARVDRSVPLRRQGSPAEIGDACLFLASDAAAYISGVILPVDGGWLAGGVPLDLSGITG
ncbi:MAG: SDR family oxidoreductase [Alphaproteobacteria bacterium]|nr:MAG: SDR family oxidoreductase [Alphaproteobacteria bacterium]